MVHPLFVFLLSLLFCTATTGDDSIAMFKLATSLTHRSWLASSSTDYCTWNGVACDSSNRVVAINLASRNLRGTLPTDLSTLSKLQFLSLQHNRLTGPLPSLANLSLLEELYLGFNKFTSIPQGFFKGLSSLKVLEMRHKPHLAPWTIPSDLAESVNLISFRASLANINGIMPDIFASFPTLQYLKLSYNNLTGTLPASFANSAIRTLRLNNQQMGLYGSINVLSSMTLLSQAWLHRNQFTGSIPDFSNCLTLFDLQLIENRFTGIVPASLISHPHLLNVSLSHNKLQGPVPEFPTNINVVDDSATNNFCVSNPRVACDPQVKIMLEIAGAVGYPETLSDSWQGNDACKNWVGVVCDVQNRIISVNLGKLHFAGTISSAFANLTALRIVHLNDNNLTGFIPDVLINLPHLQVLDVSNNNLSGKIPAFASSLELITRPGNPFLDINTDSGSEGPTDGSVTQIGKRGRQISPSIIAGVVVAVIIFITVVSFFLHKYQIKKRRRMSGSVNSQEVENELVEHGNSDFVGGNVEFSMQLIRQVTDNFNENNVLGKGGFGVVYKGELQDRTKIAVKRMKSIAMSNIKGMNEFQAEIAVLTKARHRHLVSFLGYCVHGSEGFLIYEYMSQGTLAQHLFEWREHKLPPLTWKQRVRIALDVARGVEYLHNLAEQSLSFIHRDLKPSNILLGDDMRAKVSDFGLVKNVPAVKNSLETRVAGTFGYLAPEYAETGRVTRKVDIYAFGAILMEMITGRKAIDDTREEDGWMYVHLVTWFRGVSINKENILNTIDQTLNPDEEILKSIYEVAELARHCTADNPRRRPDIADVVNVLVSLVEQWKPASQEKEDHHTSLFSGSFTAEARNFLIDPPSLGNGKHEHVTI